MLAADYICAIDGAWGVSPGSLGKVGIGGWIKDKSGKLVYNFSGPLEVNSSLEAKIGAIIHVAEVVGYLISKGRFINKKLIVCTDSMEAMDLIRLDSYLCKNLSPQGFNLKRILNTCVKLDYVPRDFNEDANPLAKMGLARPRLIGVWASF